MIDQLTSSGYGAPPAAASPFRTMPLDELRPAPVQPRATMAGPLYDAFFGSRKALIKNPQLAERMPQAVGALGLGAGVARIAQGKFIGGEELALVARGLNSTGIVRGVFRDRAPAVAHALEGVASLADLRQAVHDVRPSVLVGHMKDAAVAGRTLADRKATGRQKFAAGRKAIVGLANDVSNMDTLFGAVGGVAKAMPGNAIGRAAGKLAGHAAFVKSGAVIKRVLPVANWILFADSTIDMVKVNADPCASLGKKLAADAAWLANGLAVAGVLPPGAVQCARNAYTAIKLAQTAYDLAGALGQRQAAPPSLDPVRYFAAAQPGKPVTGRYNDTIRGAFAAVA